MRGSSASALQFLMKNWPSFFLVCEQPGQYHSCLVIQPKEIKAAWAVIRFRLLVLDTILVCTAQTTGVVSSCRYKRQSKVTEYVSLLVLAKSGLPNLLWALAKHPVCRICTLAKKKKKACCVFQSHSLLSLYTNHSWLMEVVSISLCTSKIAEFPGASVKGISTLAS